MRGSRKGLALFVLGLISLLIATACSSNNGGGSSTQSNAPVTKGGTYRSATSSFGFVGDFDPVGEYTAVGFSYYQMLLRTLLNYTGEAGAAGLVPHPDLATDLGTVSSDGLTYTYHLKDNIKFGPPINREITSSDIKYAFERIDSSSLVAQYAFYYDGVIQGMAQHSGPPRNISGIDTPDPKTIVFHLTTPTSDFPARLSLAATAPVPEEVAKCFTKPAGGYGNDIVSSGPYMIQGADQMDPSSCSTIKPMSGYDPTSHLILVRNPNWDQSTDNLRKAYVNGLNMSIDSNVDDIFNKISSGSLDGSFYEIPPPTVLQKYSTTASLKPYMHIDPQNTTYYLSMNLIVPPFDDIHVRKAVNWIIDKAGIQKAWGGPATGTIAGHIMPPSMAGLGTDYNPYGTPGNTGDLAKAEAEMKQSKYDPGHTGKCTDPVCNGVILLNRNEPPWTDAEAGVVAALAKIGINVKARELESGAAYQTIDTVKTGAQVGISMNPRWGADYGDPNTFAQPLFSSQALIPVGTSNYSMVGMTSAQAKKFGVTYPAGGVPSADSQINSCLPKTGQDRETCFQGFDKYLMEQVVPWVPMFWANQVTITSPTVTNFAFDQFTGFIALQNVAVSNNASP